MNPHTDPETARRRNRGMLVALFVLFFGGMLLAGLLRFSGWRPEGSKNKGEMLQPYGDLRDYTPTLANGGAYGGKDEPRICRIEVTPPPFDAVAASLGTEEANATRARLSWPGEDVAHRGSHGRVRAASA